MKRARRRTRALALYAAGGVLILVLVVGGLAYGAHRPEVLISSVRVEGAEVADTGDIAMRAEKALSGSYFFFFPKANFFLYPENAITRDVSGSDTRIKDVRVERDGNALVVSVSEHAPAYLWCDTTGERTATFADTADEKCFFANDEGFVFAEAPSFSGHMYTVFRGPLYGEGADSRGKQYAPYGQFDTIITFLSLLKEDNIFIQSVRMMGSGDYAVMTDMGSEIRFSITQDITRIIDNLQSVSEVLSKKDGVEYIDLRFGNKVFYKER